MNLEREAERRALEAAGPRPAETATQRAVREQKERFNKLVQSLERSMTDNDAFAGPLRECMQDFEDRAVALRLETGEDPKMFQVSTSRNEQVEVPLYALHLMSITPADYNDESWASDQVLEVRIATTNPKIRQHKAYIAPIAPLNMFMYRHDSTNKDVVTKDGEPVDVVRSRQQYEERQAAIDSAANIFDPTLYPAGMMPPDTTCLLLLYSISDMHWVTVEIRVNDAKTHGHVRLYNEH